MDTSRLMEQILSKDNLNAAYEQWPEMTYLLLQVINKLKDDRDKAVLLSHIFQFREREAGNG